MFLAWAGAGHTIITVCPTTTPVENTEPGLVGHVSTTVPDALASVLADLSVAICRNHLSGLVFNGLNVRFEYRIPIVINYDFFEGTLPSLSPHQCSTP